MDNIRKLNGIWYAKMLKAGAANLKAHAQAINDLNVFPIPDGDTGDNMLLTITGGVNAVGEGTESIEETSRKAADGMLLSARGNSGVILSQIFEGIAVGFKNVESADNTAIVAALQEGVNHAYHAVLEPTEGTILTVVRCATEHVSGTDTEDVENLIKDFISEARSTLKKTPDMLPVLKKAGVVDSGGAGLIEIFEGMLKTFSGEDEIMDFHGTEHSGTAMPELDLSKFDENSVLEYGYCTELLVRLQRCKTDIEKFDVNIVTDYLKSIGNSVVAFTKGSILKLHVHTKTPDKVMAFCQRYGEFLKVKVENMSLQHNNTELDEIEVPALPEREERKAYGVVAVASGEGIKQLFKDRGVDVIVDGGQCMNPSTEDFIEAFKRVNADTVIVYPNNSNIVLTAKQAADMYKDSDVRVIESHNIGQGYSSLTMLSFDSEDTDEIVSDLTDAMEGVVTAEISKSIRETEEVHAGEYIGFVGKNIIAQNENRLETAYKTVDHLNFGMYDICIVIRGKDADAEEAEKIKEYLNNKYPEKEIYIIDGMQEIYDYILIIE